MKKRPPQRNRRQPSPITELHNLAGPAVSQNDLRERFHDISGDVDYLVWALRDKGLAATASVILHPSMITVTFAISDPGAIPNRKARERLPRWRDIKARKARK